MLRLCIGAHATPRCMRKTQRASPFIRKKVVRFQACGERNEFDLYQECEIRCLTWLRSMLRRFMALQHRA